MTNVACVVPPSLKCVLTSNNPNYIQDPDRLWSYGIVPEVAFDVVTHQKGDSPADVIAVILLGEWT